MNNDINYDDFYFILFAPSEFVHLHIAEVMSNGEHSIDEVISDRLEVAIVIETITNADINSQA